MVKASTSWVTFMVPSCAAKAAPVRPAMIMPVIMAPISRIMAMPDQIRHVDLGAKLLELHGADEGEDDADQEAYQCYDGEGLGAALLDQEK